MGDNFRRTRLIFAGRAKSGILIDKWAREPQALLVPEHKVGEN